MTKDITLPASFSGAMSSVFANAAGDELGAGIQSGFAIVSYRGKTWSIKFQGNETPLMRDDGDGARGSIECIIVKAAAPISKIYYKDGWVDGSNAAPDCWSTNGLTPDPASSDKQNTTCAGCKQNVWGSKITEAGKQAKACADSKRLAIVPMNDIDNDLFGGPMLLRIPAASLKDVKLYGDMLQQRGFSYFAVATRISFDVSESYPKFVLNAIRPLTDDEAVKIMELRDDIRVSRILEQAVENVHHEPDAGEEGPGDIFEQTQVAASAAKPSHVAAKPAPAKPAPAKPAPVAAKPTLVAVKSAPAKPATAARPVAKPASVIEAEAVEEEVAESVTTIHNTDTGESVVLGAPKDFDSMLEGLLPK